ncbi:actinia tenebrosa protease inhibitors-like [Saccostrea cucullata]|uniref:actinia tenebrosa protease inhibitors-like n=1 Tax=Saccostrea cuccullata TaxID=36930 RepID=UPI002ED033A6
MERMFLLLLVLTIVNVVVNGQKYRPLPNPICSLPPKSGFCKAYIPRYYYDTKTGTCQKFIYGGCGGNVNNFRTKELCNRICHRNYCSKIGCFDGACTIQKCPAFPRATCIAVCPCWSVWVYNGEDVTTKCYRKGYMLIDTYWCIKYDIDYNMKQTSKQTAMERYLLLGLVLAVVFAVVNGQEIRPSPPTRSICSLPKEPGNCRGYCPRYYYDTKTGTCQRFIYGCCGGNLNNFATLKLCNRICRLRVCPYIACIRRACTFETCPAFPEATCVAVCPCESVWIYNGEDVTDQCNNKG